MTKHASGLWARLARITRRRTGPPPGNDEGPGDTKIARPLACGWVA